MDAGCGLVAVALVLCGREACRGFSGAYLGCFMCFDAFFLGYGAGFIVVLVVSVTYF